MRRALAAGVLLAALAAATPTVPAAAAPSFVDVPPSFWAYDEITAAVAAGYVDPITPRRFRPAQAMTRAEGVTMLWRASGSPTRYPPHGLDDVPATLEPAVQWSVAEGVATGLPGGHFRPNGIVRRAQLVSWLWSLDGEPVGRPASLTDVGGVWYRAAARWAVGDGIARGLPGRRFDGTSGVRRDQAAAWLDTWLRPRPPEVTLTASLTDTNLVTVSWTVRNGLRNLAPVVDVEPLVGRRATSCDGVGRCSASVRTSRGGVNRFTITVRNVDGGLAQASTDLVVPRPPRPEVAAPVQRIDPFASPPSAQVLSWTRPPGLVGEPPIGTDFVKVRRSSSIFPLGPELALDGSLPLTGSNRAERDPVSWSISYCRRPVADGASLCSFDRTVTIDPRTVVFDAPFRRFVDTGEDVTLHWGGYGDHWVVDAPTLGVEAEEVMTPSITIPGADVTDGAHAVTVRACHGPCGTADPDRPFDDRMQVVAGLEDQRPHWTERSLLDDFDVERLSTTGRWTTGSPLDVTFGDDGDLWSIGEFSRDLLAVEDGEVTHLDVPYARRTTTDGDGIEQRDRVRPYGNPLGTCTANSSDASALGERVVWTGEQVWFTQGGVFGDPCGVANHSRVVRFDPGGVDDPGTEGDDRFCAVNVPGDDNNVVGLGYDAVRDRIWFTELDIEPDRGHGALGWFDAADVGCDNALDYEDPAAVAAADAAHACDAPTEAGCIHRVELAMPDTTPATSSHPTHLTVDQPGGYVWVTDYVGAVLSRYPLDGQGPLEQFPLPTPTATWSFTGSFDWQLRVTDDAVYVIEYADNQVLRFDTTADDLAASCGELVEGANPCVREVFLPLGASTVNAHSMALDGDRLWFTLANESLAVRDPDDTKVGYLDLSTWTADDAPDGVLYGDLDAVGELPERDHRSPRGIDVDGAGRVVLSELGGELDLLTPA